MTAFVGLAESLKKQFNVFTSKIDQFDGSTSVIDFIFDVNTYCRWLGKSDDDDKLCVLVSNLTGEAKDVYRLVKDQTFDNVVFFPT